MLLLLLLVGGVAVFFERDEEMESAFEEYGKTEII